MSGQKRSLPGTRRYSTASTIRTSSQRCYTFCRLKNGSNP